MESPKYPKRPAGNGSAEPAPPVNNTGISRWLPRIRSEELFAGNRRVLIEHEGKNYILQITRHGKLILTL